MYANLVALVGMSNAPSRTVSIVIQVRNQERELPSFSRDLERGLARLGASAEIVFVDDGSTDRTADALQALAATDARVTAIVLVRPYGHSAACLAGVLHARGDTVFVMSSLRDDFELTASELGAALRTGTDVVFGRKLVAANHALHAKLGIGAPEPLFATGQVVALSTRARDALASFRRESGRTPATFAELGFTSANLGRPGGLPAPSPPGPVAYFVPVAAVFAASTLFALLAVVGAMFGHVSALAFVLTTWVSALAFAACAALWVLARLEQLHAAVGTGYAIRASFRGKSAAAAPSSSLELPAAPAAAQAHGRAAAQLPARTESLATPPEQASPRPAVQARTRTIAGGAAASTPPPTEAATAAADDGAIDIGYPKPAAPDPRVEPPDTNPYLAQERAQADARERREQSQMARSQPPPSQRKSTLHGVPTPTPPPELSMPSVPPRPQVLDTSAAEVDASHRGDE